MKILFVHRLIDGFGGAHKYFLNLVQRLSDAGWSIDVILNPNREIERELFRITRGAITVHTLDFDNTPHTNLGSEFDKIISAVRPDVIDFEAAAKTLRQMALNSTAFRTTAAYKCFTMHLPIVTDQSALRSWKRHLPWSQAWRSIAERRMFLRLFDSGLSVSQFHAAEIGHLLNTGREFFEVIPNGVEIDQFGPLDHSARSEARCINIIACGGLTKQKRYDLLISAAALLVKTVSGFRIEIAGDGAERRTLELQIAEFNLEDYVYLKGYVEDVPEFLRSGDIYVMCSDSEGLPYAAIEAMATGLPMVVTRAGELPYMVADGRNGFVVDCGSAEQTATALKKLMMSADLRIDFGDSSREIASRNFNAQENWRRVDDVYNSFIDGREIVARRRQPTLRRLLGRS